MTTVKMKDLSSFGTAAVSLDFEFQELERLAQKIERMSLQTDQGIDRAVELIREAESCRERMVKSMQEMAENLETVRERGEQAVRSISGRATIINERQKEAARLGQRFAALGEMVKSVSLAISQIAPAGGGFSPEQRALLEKTLPEFNDKMDILLSEAKKLMEEAHAANLVAIERSAESLSQKLDSARQRLNYLAQEAKTVDPTVH